MIVMAFKQNDGTFRLEADHKVVAEGFMRPTDALTWGERNGYVGDGMGGEIDHMEALGWAFTHAPTQEAYRRSTGEDIVHSGNLGEIERQSG